MRSRPATSSRSGPGSSTATSALWDDPDVFDPDRWRPEAKAGRHRFQYLPFGGGPRLCVGMRFATIEALAVLAHWLRQWSFAPMPGREVRASGMITLRPAGGLPLILARRGCTHFISVIPAKAGIHLPVSLRSKESVDPRFRGDDEG